MADKPDFRGMVSSAKQRAEKEVAQKAADQARAREARQQQVAAGVAWLRDIARPLLDEARSALREQDVKLVTRDDFDVVGFVEERWPAIVFHCTSGPIPSGNGSYERKTRAFSIESNGQHFRIGKARSQYTQWTDDKGPHFAVTAEHRAARIADSIKECIDEYFQSTTGR